MSCATFVSKSSCLSSCHVCLKRQLWSTRSWEDRVRHRQKSKSQRLLEVGQASLQCARDQKSKRESHCHALQPKHSIMPQGPFQVYIVRPRTLLSSNARSLSLPCLPSHQQDHRCAHLEKVLSVHTCPVIARSTSLPSPQQQQSVFVRRKRPMRKFRKPSTTPGNPTDPWQQRKSQLEPTRGSLKR